MTERYWKLGLACGHVTNAWPSESDWTVAIRVRRMTDWVSPTRKITIPVKGRSVRLPDMQRSAHCRASLMRQASLTGWRLQPRDGPRDRPQPAASPRRLVQPRSLIWVILGRPGTRGTARRPGRTQKAAHLCEWADAASRQAPVSSRPSTREHADSLGPLQAAPPRGGRDVA